MGVLMLSLRAVQGVLAIIILGLAGYVANWYSMDTLTQSPSQVNFMVFVPLLTLVSLAYVELVPKFMPRLYHPWAVMSLEVTNVLFYFAGFVALAVFLSKLLFCRGAVCGSAKAVTVFGAFEFALWATTAAFTVMEALKGGSSPPKFPARGQRSMNGHGGNMQPQQGGAQMKEAPMGV